LISVPFSKLVQFCSLHIARFFQNKYYRLYMMCQRHCIMVNKHIICEGYMSTSYFGFENKLLFYWLLLWQLKCTCDITSFIANWPVVLFCKTNPLWTCIHIPNTHNNTITHIENPRKINHFQHCQMRQKHKTLPEDKQLTWTMLTRVL